MTTAGPAPARNQARIIARNACSTSVRANTPYTPPSASTTKYSLAGTARIANNRSSPARSAPTRIPGTRSRDNGPTVTHGRRCSGVANTAASRTNPTGSPPLSTTTKPRAPSSPARRNASANGTSGATGIARRVNRRAPNSGNRSRNRSARNDCTAPAHMKPATNAPKINVYVRAPASAPSDHTAAPTSTTTANPRPAHDAAIVPVNGRPLNRHTTARNIRPPSNGNPGNRLNAATNRFETANNATIRPANESTSNKSPIIQNRPPNTNDNTGPAADTKNSCRAVSGFSISETPPKNWIVIRRTGNPNRNAVTACANSCTNTDTYNNTAKPNDNTNRHAPNPGNRLSNVGANNTVITTAITSHVGATYTGTPNGRPMSSPRLGSGRRTSSCRTSRPCGLLESVTSKMLCNRVDV